MLSADQLTEKILYFLALDSQVKALAERLLIRFHSMVSHLPASADHHHSGPGGLYQHSIEVGLRALREFEGNILTERLCRDSSLSGDKLGNLGLSRLVYLTGSILAVRSMSLVEKPL